MTEECRGQVTVTDPAHPLFGRTLKLSGLACLPGHVRHCQVELNDDQLAYIPVTSTDLVRDPRPEPTVLTPQAIAELVATFQAWRTGRSGHHADHPQPSRLDASETQRTRRRHRGHRPDPHGGAGR